MFPSIKVQFTDPHPSPSNKMCHILRVHKIQLVWEISTLILILILRRILHFKELCPKHFRDWTNHIFQEPKELGDIVNTGDLVHRYLPKQMDIDKILKVIQRKAMKGTHLLMRLRKYRQVIYIAHILKIYTSICHKINYLLLNHQPGE